MNPPKIKLTIKDGSLLDQTDVDAIVNPWNRNFIPPYLFQATGVAKALQKTTGKQPWEELSRKGILKTGEAVVTDGGKLNQDIIHVAGINLFWTATNKSIQTSAENAVKLAWEKGYKSIAMPLIGSGTGNKSKKETLSLIQNQISKWHTSPTEENIMEVRLIIFNPRQNNNNIKNT